MLVITGGPGVGKTTIVNSISRIVAAKATRVGWRPTGRAAKRLDRATGREAKTIHRLLEFDPKSSASSATLRHPLECDLVVIDEASMVDVLAHAIVAEGRADHSALLIVGDVDQLPSVGPGQVLADIIGLEPSPPSG